jgi:hypothetical protein
MKRIVRAAAVAVVAVALAGAAQAREVYQGRLLNESGGQSRRISIIVDSFTSPEESTRLQELLRDDGERALEKAIGKLAVGTIQIGDVRSYPIATATVFENRELNTRRLLLLISRPISFGEFANGGHSLDYPYTFVELAMNGPGIDDRGNGEMLGVAKIEAVKDGRFEIENLEARPRRILTITRIE